MKDTIYRALPGSGNSSSVSHVLFPKVPNFFKFFQVEPWTRLTLWHQQSLLEGPPNYFLYPSSPWITSSIPPLSLTAPFSAPSSNFVSQKKLNLHPQFFLTVPLPPWSIYLDSLGKSFPVVLNRGMLWPMAWKQYFWGLSLPDTTFKSCISFTFLWGSLHLVHRWSLGFTGGDSGKEPACQCRRSKRHGFDPWVEKIPWRRVWQCSCLGNSMDRGA